MVMKMVNGGFGCPKVWCSDDDVLESEAVTTPIFVYQVTVSRQLYTISVSGFKSSHIDVRSNCHLFRQGIPAHVSELLRSQSRLFASLLWA